MTNPTPNQSHRSTGARHAQPDANPVVNAMEHLLREQLTGHELLLKCVERKRHGIRTADITAITEICGEENVIIQRLASLEKSRLELIGRLTRMANPNADRPLTMTQVAQMADEPGRSRLLALAAQVRDAVAELRQQSSIVRAAAETLSRHMSGIVQSVHSALSRARVYGNRGSIAMGAPLRSFVDIKS